ncbi:hypothetical protein EYF80_027752 [Liparis tanakae]|uniref:Uncharacterized protein n=1 Tax=Liparis tanakae TaxID=230148 RepID=A0A4Z2HAV1_9TELE|nr:hypothetical protein EYF80_027752 [Liparis tanakae]
MKVNIQHLFENIVLCCLPDVLSGPGLDHNPHLQLLCALKQARLNVVMPADNNNNNNNHTYMVKLDSGRGTSLTCVLTSSDSLSSSVSSTWTTASAPQGIGAPVVTLIT